jgi:hypothetical protein
MEEIRKRQMMTPSKCAITALHVSGKDMKYDRENICSGKTDQKPDVCVASQSMPCQMRHPAK